MVIQGNQQTLSQAHIDQLQKATNFSEAQLKLLFLRFKQVNSNKTGSLSVDEFLGVPELDQNPLVRRVFAIFDGNGDQEVSFQEFVQGLAIFTSDSKEDKFKFVFKVYDSNNDGFISNGDLFHVLKAMVGANLTDIQLQQLVDRTILRGDKDKDGRLSYAEFYDMIKNSEIDSRLSVEIPEP